MDARPHIGAALDAFGVAATVTTPGGDPVSTRVVWTTPTTEHPLGADIRVAEWRRILAIPLAGLAGGVPRGTAVSAPEVEDGPVMDWTVDEFLRLDVDHYRVAVVPA